MDPEIWELALKLAGAQRKLKSDLLPGQRVVHSQHQRESAHKLTEKIMQGTIDEILQRPDSEKILAAVPKAEEYLDKMAARNAAINKTLFGSLHHALDLLIRAQAVNLQSSLREDEIQKTGLPVHTIDLWQRLEKGIEKGDKFEVIQSLRALCYYGIEDLTIHENQWPPLPEPPVF